MKVLSKETVDRIEGPLPGGFYRVNGKTYLTGNTVSNNVIQNMSYYDLVKVESDMFGEYYTIWPANSP